MRSRVGYRYPVFFDRAVGTDQRGRAYRPFRDFALSVFARSPCAVCFHRILLRIGQQNERQIELVDELVVRVDAIGAYPDNDRVGFCDVVDSVAEPARFFGSTRGIVFRIKPKNNVLSGIFGETMLFAVASSESKRRSFLTFETCHQNTSVENVTRSLSHSESCSQPIISLPF